MYLEKEQGSFEWWLVFPTICFMVGNTTCWNGLLTLACDNPGLVSECRLG